MIKQKRTNRRPSPSQVRFHTWFTVCLALISLALIFFVPNISLFVALIFLILYVAGNGLIHVQNKTFTRDIIIEYALVAAVVLIVVVGAAFE